MSVTHSTIRYHLFFFSIHDSTKSRCNEYGGIWYLRAKQIIFLVVSVACTRQFLSVGRSVWSLPFPNRTRPQWPFPTTKFKIHICHSVSLWITKCKLPLSNPTRLQPSSVGHKVLMLEFQRLAWSTDQPTNQWLWLDTDTEVRSRT